MQLPTEKSKPRILRTVLFVLLGMVLFALIRRPTPKVDAPDVPVKKDSPDAAAEIRTGKLLAEQACQGCHMLPAPQDLDRFTWAMHALPLMSRWTGVNPVDWNAEPSGFLVSTNSPLLGSPAFDPHQWHAVVSYYLDAAPTHPLPQASKPAMRIGLDHFVPEFPEYRYGRPMTTLVKIDEERHKLYLYDAEARQFVQLNKELKVEANAAERQPITDLILRPDGFLLTHIGNVLPSHERNGQISFVPRPSASARAPSVLLKDMMRPTQTVVADFNGDGIEDLAVCEFGNVIGQYSVFYGRAGGSYTRQVLINRAGAVRSQVYDLDSDGHPDLVVMMAQGREGIYRLMNRGDGTFDEIPIVEKGPAWGFSYFELVDFNHDGFIDILATNGDNGDSPDTPPVLKPYHGIRLYLNDGHMGFHEAWFYPMYGAYKARALDFDGDGDLDIAAISFFPDYLGGFKESFVYLQQDAPLVFSASTFTESIAGRWMTFDAGDLDGDGDVDIVLGAFNRAFHDVPDELGREWALHGPSFLVLWNTTKGTHARP